MLWPSADITLPRADLYCSTMDQPDIAYPVSNYERRTSLEYRQNLDTPIVVRNPFADATILF